MESVTHSHKRRRAKAADEDAAFIIGFFILAFFVFLGVWMFSSDYTFKTWVNEKDRTTYTIVELGQCAQHSCMYKAVNGKGDVQRFHGQQKMLGETITVVRWRHKLMSGKDRFHKED